MMFFVGGPRHGTAFPTMAVPRIVRMRPGFAPEIVDPGESPIDDPEWFVHIPDGTHYRRQSLGIVVLNPLTGKPNNHAHRTSLYIHESALNGGGALMALVHDAAVRWVLATFGEEVHSPLAESQNGNNNHSKGQQS
jgi:hypothetical protein